MLFRYSRWDGTQNLSDLDADDLLAAMSDDLMSDGDLWSALRRMFQRGTQNPQGQRMPGLQDLLDRETLLRQTIGAELAHTNAVTPSAPGEDESNHPIVFVIDSIDDEKLFLQTEGRTDAAAANMTDALRADDFQIDYAS